jgi:methyl-accepting chemotaxis protein
MASPHAHLALAPPGDLTVKLNNLTITPKLGILVGVTLLCLCLAGVLAG